MDSRPRCIIVGAAGGIGRALVARLSDRWGLILAGRSEAPLVELAAASTAVAAPLDATDFDAVEALFAAHPGVTAAVNLAGSILLKPAHSTTAAEFEQTMALNLGSAFAVTRAAAKCMRQGGGSVVLLSSCAASIGLANHEAIAAAKAGVEGLVRAAAATYAASGLRFNAVAPGLVDTPMAARITGNEAALKASVAMHPMGRIGTPDDVARAIEFLLEPSSGWITGQVLGVDGGLARIRGR